MRRPFRWNGRHEASKKRVTRPWRTRKHKWRRLSCTWIVVIWQAHRSLLEKLSAIKRRPAACSACRVKWLLLDRSSNQLPAHNKWACRFATRSLPLRTAWNKWRSLVWQRTWHSSRVSSRILTFKLRAWQELLIRLQVPHPRTTKLSCSFYSRCSQSRPWIKVWPSDKSTRTRLRTLTLWLLSQQQRNKTM